MDSSLRRRLTAEFIGTAIFLAGIVGSTITISSAAATGGIGALVSLLVGAMIVATTLGLMIAIFGRVSGGHFNPAVSMAFAFRGELSFKATIAYMIVQIAGGVLGVVIAHFLFGQNLIEISGTAREGLHLGVSEMFAAFLLVFAILAGAHWDPRFIPALVMMVIFCASWFTPSGAFANPAVTIARIFTDTSAGISAASVPIFVVAQLIGAMLAVFLANEFMPKKS